MLTHSQTTKQPAMEGQTDPKAKVPPTHVTQSPHVSAQAPASAKQEKDQRRQGSHPALQKANNWGGPFPLNLYIFKPLHPEFFRPSTSDLQALNSSDPLTFQFSSF